MRYALIREMDVSNGKGVGVSLFVQGCPFHCDGCFNPETWDFSGGHEWTEEVKDLFINLAKRKHITRISILGGEPLANQNYEGVMLLVEELKREVPDKKIWLYTGFDISYDDIIESKRLLSLCDVIVDGQFVKNKKDIRLAFKGSTNQRVIDVQKTLKNQRTVLFSEE